ncbi:MAG: nucleotide exchange factor GrpE [Planctomycetaceae bacterium]|jgi:molecular chaperone GrpE|nr:nucleotide exchange factor GrpE [Planctomycetaceae bacterium]MBT6488093.1 nucleotide exchange factor GrpE [Planctomycetaceae bacterium]MBT6495278.1 nucleotide exchange factor GrpE [Planctomycetaceae bacterium]
MILSGQIPGKVIVVSDTEKQQPTEDSQTADPATETSAEAPVELTLEEQLAACRNESQEHYDQMLRARAELENVRKRAQKEQQEIRQFQSMSMIRDLLPTLDNLGRAIEAAGSSDSVDGLLQGVEMVRKQLADALARYSVKPIESVGKPFDPNLHEAVQQLPSADYPAMTVLQEVERGYTLHDRVVRPSKVIVSSEPPQE